jgi:integrase
MKMAVRMPFMQRRSDSKVWQFRLRVPADLLQVYGKESIRQSLGTTDMGAARQATGRLVAQYEAEFAAHRRAMKPETLHVVTPAMLDQLCERIKWRILDVDDRLRYEPQNLLGYLRVMEVLAPPQRYLTAGQTPAYLNPDEVGLTPERIERLKQIEQSIVGVLTKQLTFGRFEFAEAFADGETKALGYRIEWEAPENRRALLPIMRAVAAAWRLAARRSHGDLVDTPVEPALDTLEPPKTPETTLAPRRAQRSTGQTLFDVADIWAKTQQSDSINKTQRALKLLKDSGQPVGLHDINRRTGLAFKAFLMEPEREFSGVTAGKHWHCVMAIINYAAHELALIDANPWKGTAAPTGKSEKRKPWSVEQLQRLFDSPLFTSYELPEDRKAGADAAYWLQVMAIYSGARLHEVADLTLSDLETRNGIATFTIRDAKSDAGKRIVPIHSELIRLGFLDYVEDRKETGKATLWTLNDQPSREGSTFYSDWHRSYRRSQGFTQKLLDFHSFRHTAVSAIRGVIPALPETAIDQTVGHESVGSEGAKRYAQHPVESLQRVVESLRYPGLDLPRVYPTRNAS